MTLILNLEVTGNTGFVSIAENGIATDSIFNEKAMEHASFLQPAIKQILERNGYAMNNLDAIGLSNGPGSYTGLRVGMASAKGLAFALGLPLITINTLQLMAWSVNRGMAEDNINFVNKSGSGSFQSNSEPLQEHTTLLNDYGKEFLICPMIDARRMDVFFALFDQQNKELIEPSNTIIGQNFLQDHLQKQKIIFSGSGAAKLEKILKNSNACFALQPIWDKGFAELSFQYYNEKKFSNIHQAEPFYCKEFYDAAAQGT